ncbi:MAG: type II toxin-antitoxin system Phd/YefM family antitoxin [Pseudomonadales bacterium]
MYTTSDIYPVSDFNRKPAEHIKRLQETQTPEILTVNGKAAVVMVDPESYDQLIQAADLSRTLEQIALAKSEYKNGQSQSLEQAFNDLKKRLKSKYPDANL